MIFPESLRQESPRRPELPLYRDWAVDWEEGHLARRGGLPYLVSGMEALKSWVYKALRTRPGIFVAYSPGFGLRYEPMEGRPDEAAMTLEHKITRTLTRSPYITGVSGFSFAREGDRLRVDFTVSTVYGDMDTEVTQTV